MQTHSLALLAAFAGLLAGPTALARQATNQGDTNGSAVNPGSAPSGSFVGVARLLSSPRLSPATTNAERLAVIARTALFQVDPPGPTVDYRESIGVWALDGSGIDFVIDEGGQTGVDSDGNGQIDVFGGAAYSTSALVLNQTGGFSPYLSGGMADVVEHHTFGGLTINGGPNAGDVRIAFYAGIENPGTTTAENRELPPTLTPQPVSSHDPTKAGEKAVSLRRGIWSSVGLPTGISLRALEQSPNHLAPQDPDGTLFPFSRQFRRLNPSDYGPNSPPALPVGSLMLEQRHSRVSNIAMNASGAIALRGDVGASPTDILLGIWADQVAGGSQTLHRVFVENDAPGNPGLVFDHSASNNPAPGYRVAALGAPAFSDSASEPLVAAYAVVRGIDSVQGDRPPAVAIVARQPGLDGSNPTGFTPKILAIENEPFNIVGTTAEFTFVNSLYRSGSNPFGGLNNPGTAGLADVAERQIESGIIQESFKNLDPGMTSYSIYKPRPAISSQNEIAFLGRVDTINGSPVFVSDNLTGSLLDEGVYTTLGASGGAEFTRIAFEGQAAPVVVNGAPLLNARFARLDSSPFFGDPQTFSRPIMNNSGQVLFIAGWVDDPSPFSPGDELYGRSIFIWTVGGSLECVVSSGDVLSRTIETTTYDLENQPTGSATINVELFGEFCRVPFAQGNGFGDEQTTEQASLSDCGVVTFTDALVEVNNGAFEGWGLFSINTADPRPGLGLPRVGPQLVVKTSGAEADEDEEAVFSDGTTTISVSVAGANNMLFHEGIAYGFGDPEGGDTALHADGTLVLAVNPDGDTSIGRLFVARQSLITLDYDGDGQLDGCDACPTGPPCGGGGGECENCLECIEIDCPFGGMLLGLGPDFDQSGLVDDTDLELMMMAMGLTKGRFDMNKDGVVGEKDLAMLLDDYGKAVETK